MDNWRGYFAIERYTANLNEANWITLIEEVRQIVGVDGTDHAHNRLQERGNLDTFENEGETYSNLYIYEANFSEGAVSFDKFQNRLVNLFGVDPDKVTYSTVTTTIKTRLSCFGTYKYNNVNRVRVGLFGCASDSDLCTWGQSRVECVAFIGQGGWE